MTSLDKPKLKFDIVTLWDVLEHIRNPLDFLLCIKDFLKTDALIYISVPNGKAMLWKRRFYTMLRRNHDHDWIPWEHVFYFSIESLRSYLRKLGLEVLETGSVVCYPRPFSLFELVRRIGFQALAKVPSQAPQIYIWSRNRLA